MGDRTELKSEVDWMVGKRPGNENGYDYTERKTVAVEKSNNEDENRPRIKADTIFRMGT